jgi:hypothetical protein
MMTDDERRATALIRRTLMLSPAAIRNAGSSFVLTDPMLIVRTREAAPPTSALSK